MDFFADREALFITAGLEDLPEQSRGVASLGSSDDLQPIPFTGECDPEGCP
jgi:hypothetical protein